MSRSTKFTVNVLFVAQSWLLAAEQRYPAHLNVVDVTRPPYAAKGDGVADDSDALQLALNENVGRHRVLYFPKGTYLVSRTLTWPKRWNGKENWGRLMLRGQARDACVLKLKDGVFTNAAAAQALMWCGGFGSADWFHNHIENLTFNVGSGNPGATALQFYSNNTGAVRDCRFVASEGSGLTGLDLGHRDMNGPLLVRDCEVVGFRTGIATAHAVNSQCFENLTLRGQSCVGFDNAGQHISICGLVSDNAVPALKSYGKMMLVNATLAGRGEAAKAPAVVNYNGGRIFLRDVKTTGYKRVLADITTPDFVKAFRLTGEDKPGSLGPDIAEYCSHAATTAFPSPAESLRLPVKDAPHATWDDPATWAVVDCTNNKQDSADAIQRAVDSGATTVFLPAVHYTLSRTVVLRGQVRRVLSVSGYLNYGDDERPCFRVEDGAAPVVLLEHINGLGGGLEIATRRTVVLRSMGTHTIVNTPASEGGEVFLEDVVGDDFRFRKQRVWARQLNIENKGTHLTNDGGDLWVLGYKTERGGTLVHTLGGGRTEILGGFSYTTGNGTLAPMFVNEASSVWAFFGEVCYTGDPFATLVRETRGGEMRELVPASASTAPYSGRAP